MVWLNTFPLTIRERVTQKGLVPDYRTQNRRTELKSYCYIQAPPLRSTTEKARATFRLLSILTHTLISDSVTVYSVYVWRLISAISSVRSGRQKERKKRCHRYERITRNERERRASPKSVTSSPTTKQMEQPQYLWGTPACVKTDLK